MRSPVNPVASLVAALTLVAGLPAIALAQDVPFEPATATSPAGTPALARTPTGWGELARSDGRIAFGVKRGGARRAVIASTPFADVYGMGLEASSPMAFGRVHRFGQRGGGLIRVLPDRGNRQIPLRPGDALFVPESPSPIVWNMSSQVRISFGSAYRPLPGADADTERASIPIGSLTVEFGGRPR
jgi:hypothetical protein